MTHSTRHRPSLRYHRGMMAVRVTLLAALGVVGGCSASSSGGESGSLTPASVQPTQVPDGSPASSPGAIDLPASVIDPVAADIARVAGVPVDQVTVVSAESITFPDGSLGCAVPGMTYIQIQLDGYKIVAEAAGKTYDYRGTGPGTFRQCTTAGS